MTGCTALIVAGGRGERFGGAVAKQYQSLGGQPVLRRTLRCFLAHPRVDTVRVVIRDGDRDLYDAAAAGLSLPEPVIGGRTRQESALRGLESLESLAPATVLIHDAARPLCPPEVISRVLDALATAPAAVPAVAVGDTLKRAAEPTEEAVQGPGAGNGIVSETVDRSGLWRAQTPQGFHFAAILAAHRRLAGEACTDDAAVAERAGLAVRIVAGDEDNIKITTTDDMRRAERRLASEYGTRTGFGFDVHRFGPGDHVMLGGLRIPHGAGLIGHSDADVALHALTDAILGAIAAGDIGTLFPPTDPQWRGADSAAFLRRAADLVSAAGGDIVHVDVTIICERPRVGPHRQAMTDRIAAILGVAPGRVSVKATTTERLGFTGRGEGIAAQAVATINAGDH